MKKPALVRIGELMLSRFKQKKWGSRAGTARSRGIPFVGWAIWRHSLNIALAEETGEEARKAALEDGGQTIWVRLWSHLELPVIPSGVSQPELFLLHTLLIHDRLPADLLPLLLPLSQSEMTQALSRLTTAGSLIQKGDKER